MAAITYSSLLSNEDFTDATSYTTASFSSTANRPILAIIESSEATVSTVPTVAAHSLTWTQIGTAESNSGAIRRRLTVFEAYPGANGSGTMVIDFGGLTQSNCLSDIIEFTNGDATSMIVQSAMGVGNAFGTVTLTLAAFADATNGTFGAFCINNTTSTLTEGAGFTAVSNHADTNADAPTRLLTEFDDINDTSVDCSISGAISRRWVGIAIELKAAVQIVTGAALSASPTLPAAILRTDVLGAALAVTPNLPVGSTVQGNIYGLVLAVTPSLPAGSLAGLATGGYLGGYTTYGYIGAGAQNVVAIEAVVLTVVPVLPVGSFGLGLEGMVLSIAPSLPSGSVNRRLRQRGGGRRAPVVVPARGSTIRKR